MATEQPKSATEDVKIDLFEDDDEFEEFAIDEVLLTLDDNKVGRADRLIEKFYASGCNQVGEWEVKEEGKDVTQQWEDDWDDDDVTDDFSLQLRRELENNTEKN